MPETKEADPDAVSVGSKQRILAKSRLTSIVTNQQVLLLFFLFLMTAVFSFANPRFLSLASFGNVLQDWGPAVLLAAGQTFVIITAGVDLSVGSVMGLSAISAAMTARALNEAGHPPGVSIGAAILGAIAVGLLAGAINGVLIAYVKLAPFIATLATMAIAAGLTLVITNGVQIGGSPREVSKIGATAIVSIFTLPVIVTICAVAIAGAVLHFTRFGRWTYGIGSNRFSAKAVGISVEKHLVKVYMISGIFSALAGVFVYFRLAAGSPTTGLTMELTSIAAVIVGGTSLFGGRGTMLGSVLGAFLVTAVISGLILSGVQPNWQQIVVGMLIVLSVIAQQVATKRRD